MKNQMDLLIEFTKDEDPRTRATAIAGLAKVADQRGFAPVLVALFDPVDEVRVTAATALGVFRDPRALEPLAACLDDPCEQVAVNCVWALGQISGRGGIEQLVALLSNGGAPVALRTAAATALGERAGSQDPQLAADLLGAPELVDAARGALLQLLGSDDDELRATAAWALGHLPRSTAAVDALVAALKDPYEWTVRYAIEALGNAGDPRAVEPLQLLLAGERPELVDLAKQALALLAEC
ncbi:MAG: HEAT repeat domain-containing protein [Coriobacteriales bacterium]